MRILFQKSLFFSFILPVLILTSCVSGFSQESSKISLTYGAGIGLYSFNEQVSGLGPDVNIGISYKSKFDRLRINPNFQIGSYLSGESDSKRDEYFNCITLDLLINYTLIKIKTLSLDIQTGGFIGYSRGLIGTGTEFDNATSTDIDFSSSQFINDFNFGFKIGGGLKYTPKNGRLSYGLYPINISNGNNGYLGISSKFGLIFNLYSYRQ